METFYYVQMNVLYAQSGSAVVRQEEAMRLLTLFGPLIKVEALDDSFDNQDYYLRIVQEHYLDASSIRWYRDIFKGRAEYWIKEVLQYPRLQLELDKMLEEECEEITCPHEHCGKEIIVRKHGKITCPRCGKEIER